jgi:hypothetical protein
MMFEEWRSSRRDGRPEESLLDDEVGDAAILFLDVVGPCQILAEVRRQTLQLLELVIS